MNSKELAFDQILRIVDEAGCSGHLILVRSWAEFIYQQAHVLESFQVDLHTLDVDFLVRNMRKPNPPAHLTNYAKQSGFSVISDRLNETTKIVDLKSGLEIEFLINKRGQDLEPTLPTYVGVTAQALRHLEILSNNSITVAYKEFSVLVSMPEAYVLHKMVINGERNKKKEKDAEAILHIWPKLDHNSLERICSTLSKKQIAKVRAFRTEHNLL